MDREFLKLPKRIIQMKNIANKINFMKLLERRNLGEKGHRELEVQLDIKTGDDAIAGFQGLSSFVDLALSNLLEVTGARDASTVVHDEVAAPVKPEEVVTPKIEVEAEVKVEAEEVKAEEAPAVVEPKKPAKKATSTKEAKPRIRASKEVLFSRETDGHKKLVSHFLTEQFGTKWKVQPLLAKVVEANKTSVNLPFLTEDGMEVLESFKAQYLAKLED